MMRKKKRDAGIPVDEDGRAQLACLYVYTTSFFGFRVKNYIPNDCFDFLSTFAYVSLTLDPKGT